ncbi:peptidyl-prolyl cis-trans isomerase, cyclophilin-type domain-containing protein [Cardiosporidium cionae]|uniref:Peptidyl-prolyl cis-trans isomerase, cyclophilin-type domain-containing protein n=1 Tax=Cardiosporidium cionae TaxID=476202 RepID=A0ABQ7J4W9_9APIC|nr:peptidyl-prolyl cis-trans isomerase, cyclophilin-type domain-containing protein [Cardiosporidium cionae]|eukprot:KAF8819021.1 peptidyl-prolyl cis-trans isomerase, cyclophilin-type domain-containing protein [Cardiosporidium cionae]
MGKKRHSKDKLYIIPKEYAEDWGGFKSKQIPHFKALPFYCCGLSLLPFENPVCTKNGIVFDVNNISPFIKKHHRNPITGEDLKISDLLALHFHKNNEGQFHCPITFKVFNDHSYIIANGKSGHVYSFDAIDNLCRKPKCWKDLITGEPFTSHDLITIQNPRNLNSRKIEDFDFVKRGMEGEIISGNTSKEVPTIKKTDMMGRTHRKLLPQKKNPEISNANKSNDNVDISQKHHLYTTHRQAASFTSTVIESSCVTEFRDLTEREIMQTYYDRVKKEKRKGYVRLITSGGILNIQLHCDLAPLACDNFLRHCQSGYFEGTIFHRCIANFMIQGGDPLGTGRGGESAFEDGKPFNDEFHPHLVHKGIGILSMANNGKNTNKSQFFITFKSCEHLNNKHTVFGRVVGGIENLKAWETMKTIKFDKPKNPVMIEATVVFKNPFEEVKSVIELEKKEAEQKEQQQRKKNGDTWLGHNSAFTVASSHPQRFSDEVGKYIDESSKSTLNIQNDNSTCKQVQTKESKLYSDGNSENFSGIKKQKIGRPLLNFSSW